jgi:hypothetical protein
LCWQEKTTEEKSDTEHEADVANAMGIPNSTLRTTQKKSGNITESCKSAMTITVTKNTEISAPIMGKLERLFLLSG